MEFFRLFSDVTQFEYAQIALIASLLVCAICGLLSPLVVYKERSYVGDTLAHLVFPGVVAGLFASSTWEVPSAVSILFGAIVTAFLGTALIDKIVARLRVPYDAAAVVILTGFFAIGILGVSGQVEQGRAMSFEQILFGDILSLNWQDVGVLISVLAIVCSLLLYLRRDFECWLTDPEFAQIVGYRVKQVEKIFPALVTLTVLSGMFAVGVLLMSALLTLPALLVRPNSIISAKTIGTSMTVGVMGLLVSFQWNLPVGATIVVVGLCAIFSKLVIFSK